MLTTGPSSSFCSKTLQIDHERLVNTHPIYSNIGPALLPVNLYTYAKERGIKPGETVLMYSVGSISSTAAVIMRWGNTVLA